MVRKLFLVVGIAAAIVGAACGRQVTPNPAGLGPGGTPPGFVSVFFSVDAPFNFSNYQYHIVWNTTGDGRTPSTDTFQTNWDGYSYTFVARGSGGESNAQAVALYHNPQNPHQPPIWFPIITTPQTFFYNLDANGTGTEFSIRSAKSVFLYNPSPTPSPTSSPPQIWTFNAFVAQNNGTGQWYFVDSMGNGGPIDPQYVSPQLDMQTCFDNTYYGGTYTPPDPAAQIASIEIANNPSKHPCSGSSDVKRTTYVAMPTLPHK
ncbi:MAG TPA: hypothetical protein VHX17_04630 [Candidatus Cybelea sp.]|jgi:hypothetical protein|nr:hypothetical protein [Candidatus Cybelea sp.]